MNIKDMDSERRRYASISNPESKMIGRPTKPASSLEHYEKLLENANEERHNAVRAIRANPMADAFGPTKMTSSSNDIKPRLDGSVQDNAAYYRYGDSDKPHQKNVTSTLAVQNAKAQAKLPPPWANNANRAYIDQAEQEAAAIMRSASLLETSKNLTSGPAPGL